MERLGHFVLQDFDLLHHFAQLVAKDGHEAQLDKGQHAVAQHEEDVASLVQPVKHELAAARLMDVARRAGPLVAALGPTLTMVFRYATHTARHVIVPAFTPTNY